MLNKVIAYIEQNQLIEKKDKIVLGVSGGADSICLFLILKQLIERYELELLVVHVNHGIRGEEANADEKFVKQLSEQYSILCISQQKNIPAIVKEKGISEEEAGRIVRYEVFEQIRNQYGYNKIAVAHNKNDCAETILFHLFRGSGLKGIGGIAPKRECIIRPLLACTREEIESYLHDHGQKFVTDKTNLSTEYSRNKIRLDILPYVTKEINEKAIEHIVNTAIMVTEAEQYINKNVQIMYDRIVSVKNGKYFIQTQVFSDLDSILQKGIIYKVIVSLANKKRDIERKHVEAVIELCQKQVGKKKVLPYNITAVRTYEGIMLELENEKEGDEKEKRDNSIKDRLIQDEIKVEIGHTYRLESFDYDIIFEKIEKETNWIEIPKNNCTKWFDYDRINNVIKIRNRRSGDYLEINAQGGRKKLKNYFIDKKIPQKKRDEILLLTDGSHVMWILGDRISEHYKVTDKTKNILKVSMMEVKKNGR